MIAKERQPLRLLWVFVLGFLFSLGVVAGFFWLFAAQAAGQWAFWDLDPRLSQDVLFAVSRNAVTLAAALGVGVTLFFSFRKQQTAEKAQAVAVAAQEIATKSQELATRTLELSLNRHERETVSELRIRYARAAEQLASDKPAIQLAGIHSLTALSDDWANLGNHIEQQVCISLLCSYTNAPSLWSDDPSHPPERTAVGIILSRMNPDVAEPQQNWTSKEIVFRGADLSDGMDNVTINEGHMSIKGSRWRPYRSVAGFDMAGGTLGIQGNIGDGTFPRTINANFLNGVSIFIPGAGSREDSIMFYRCSYRGGNVTVWILEQFKGTITFQHCSFSKGNVDIWSTGNLEYSVVFEDCTFTSVSSLRVFDQKVSLTFTECEFLNDGKIMARDPKDAALEAARTGQGMRLPPTTSHPAWPDDVFYPKPQAQTKE